MHNSLITMKKMLSDFGYNKVFYVQQFVSSKKTIRNLNSSSPFSKVELENLLENGIIVR